jgi:hypothetical protein
MMKTLIYDGDADLRHNLIPLKKGDKIEVSDADAEALCARYAFKKSGSRPNKKKPILADPED